MRPNRMHVNTRRLSPAMTGSICVHTLLLLALVAVAPTSAPRSIVDRLAPLPLVWIDAGRDGGGGGGGGGKGEKEPPRTAHSPGHDAATLPAGCTPPAAPPEPVASPIDKPLAIVAPLMPIASGVEPLAGAIAVLPSPSLASHGPGSDGGFGPGRGPGDGPATVPVSATDVTAASAAVRTNPAVT